MSKHDPDMDEVVARGFSMGGGPMAPTRVDQMPKGGREILDTLPDTSVRKATQAAKAAETSPETYARMQRQIRSWGMTMLAWGVLHIIASGTLSAPWGIMLLLVGLASFYFREAAIFVVYGVTMGWVAVSNLLGFNWVWVGIALLQGVLTVLIFRDYRRFRRAQAEVAEGAPDRAARIFPWAGGALGALSLAGLAAAVGLFFAAVLTEDATWLTVFGVFAELVVDLGILALAVSLAALLSGFRYKLVSVCGLVAGVLVLLAYLGLFLLVTLG